jgi:carbamoyl-phosphate synthase large subunit
MLTLVCYSEHAGSVAVSFGGQLSQNIALKLQEFGNVNVLGTNPLDIDKAEDRAKFSVRTSERKLIITT